jgi:hypothetical protein
MKKEMKKNEKEEQKFKMKEEMNARKKMAVHIQEEIIKGKISGQKERSDAFVAFDGIDEETAIYLFENGYNTVEKLRQTTVKDLMKIGLRKKIAQRIVAECEEFVEWDVYDADEYTTRKSDTLL